MKQPDDADVLVAARSALLDALDALADQRAALVLIGAQAIYLHTGGASVALAEATKDSDLTVDPRALNDAPRLEDAMQRAGFRRNPIDPQPGSWVSPRGIPVDLMVPALLSGGGGRRGGRIPPTAVTQRAVPLVLRRRWSTTHPWSSGLSTPSRWPAARRNLLVARQS